MAYHLDDTIVALASAEGGAARSIVRLSGPRAVEIAQQVFRAAEPPPAEPPPASGAHAMRGHAQLESLGRELPASLFLWPDARSYTRQPVAELHTVGSPPLATALIGELCRHGARLAEPGEFTLRAFLAGRIDLTQAEAVLGIIDAHGPAELKVALEQLAGGLARPLAALRESLLDLLARLEAGLDFVEEDIEFISAAEIDGELGRIATAVQRLSAQLDTRRGSHELPRVVLIGCPNAGKSSLFNALSAGQALVSAQPGTTRDYLTAKLDLDGVACELVDTAGVEAADPQQPVAAQAQHHTARQSERALITLVCLDGSRPANDWELERLRAIDARRQLIVLTKCDARAGRAATEQAMPGPPVETSALNRTGLDELRRRLRPLVLHADQDPSLVPAAAVSATAARTAESVRGAAAALEHARRLNSGHVGEELVAAELRTAIAALGTVSGALATDDLLERIFNRFCIGK